MTAYKWYWWATNSKHWFTIVFLQSADYTIGLDKLSATSFSLVLKWQQVCNRQLKLY